MVEAGHGTEMSFLAVIDSGRLCGQEMVTWYESSRSSTHVEATASGVFDAIVGSRVYTINRQ